MGKAEEIRAEIAKIKDQPLTMQTVQTLALLHGALQAISDPEATTPATGAEKELGDLFPALREYKAQHSATTLQKLCCEMADFCAAVYASTQDDAERQVYRDMIERVRR